MKQETRHPRSAICWMCRQTKRIVKGANTDADVLICDYCDSAGASGPHMVR